MPASADSISVTRLTFATNQQTYTVPADATELIMYASATGVTLRSATGVASTYDIPATTGTALRINAINLRGNTMFFGGSRAQTLEILALRGNF